jgi:hypothetical protein
LGAVFRPKDLARGRRKVLERGLDDIVPSVRKEAVRILEDWKGKASMEELTKLVGKEKAKDLQNALAE